MSASVKAFITYLVIFRMEELMESSPSIEALNLLLYAMLKSGQIKETIEEIRYWIKPNKPNRVVDLKPFVLTYNVLDLLSHEAKASNDPKITDDFSKLCLKLEYFAEACDVSIPNLLMEPISNWNLDTKSLKSKFVQEKPEKMKPSWSASIVDLIFQPGPGKTYRELQNKNVFL